MKRIFKEPLLHFLLLGAGLFLAYGLMPKDRSRAEPAAIVITQGQIEHLATAFTRAWQRPPSAEELTGLIRDQVREEVCYREAVAMGLDKDDTVIRRRLRQKLEFISADIAALAEPTEADLQAYLAAHPEEFRIPTRYTFSQVCLNPAKHGANLARDTEQLLAQLNRAGANADLATLGDSMLLDPQFTAVPADEVARQFGDPFAAALDQLKPGRWQGPIKSGYGVHLVLINDRTEGYVPTLAAVRPAVHTACTNARRQEVNERFYQGLLTRYTVTIEQPPAAALPPKAPAPKLAVVK